MFLKSLASVSGSEQFSWKIARIFYIWATWNIWLTRTNTYSAQETIEVEKKDKLKNLYENYPYPGRGPMPPAYELLNFYKLYLAENSFADSGLSILDAGVGSGNRLLELVREFPDNAYTAIDYSQASLSNAEALFRDNGIEHVSFKLANLEEDISALGQYDIIFCMGVVHHLRNPHLALTNISRLCHSNSMLTFYVYGELGSHERMRRKHIVEKLAGADEGMEWFDWVRRCDFGELPYGWRGLGDGLPLYFDAYKNPQEELYSLKKNS